MRSTLRSTDAFETAASIRRPLINHELAELFDVEVNSAEDALAYTVRSSWNKERKTSLCLWQVMEHFLLTKAVSTVPQS